MLKIGRVVEMETPLPSNTAPAPTPAQIFIVLIEIGNVDFCAIFDKNKNNTGHTNERDRVLYKQTEIKNNLQGSLKIYQGYRR